MNETDIRNRLLTAGQAQRTGDRQAAAAIYRDIIARAGEQPVALNALGMQALGSGDPVAAAALFRRAAAADPRSPDLCINLATALRRQGDDAGEQAALEAVLAIDQRHFMALVRLAELFERTGQEARAAERWSGVLAIAALMDDRSPAVETMLVHARAKVVRQQASFADAIEAGLGAAREAVTQGARRRFDACIDHLLGRREIHANRCSGLHFPFLPADEFFDRDHFPWMAKLEAQTDVIRAELVALLAEDAAAITPYVAMPSGTPENKWSPLDNRLAWGAFHLWKNGRRDDAACARCPATTAIIEALPLAELPERAPTVFFSLLQPGTHLPAHSGVSNVRAIVHLPLIVPAGCTFRVGGETRDWREGEAWAFDDTIDHEAWNRSDALRAILIFDVWNPHIRAEERALLRAFFPVADAHGYDLRASVGD
ncbi:aspartyl/asparaginyl beta-hydroxylase domain-containing protein [Sphingomonas montana]|uniref:aspartyl/asparaginyl beta-hydroxylase domain-containing protein n=1 Tax=Sphingomonas montana TaxID=1843236 RepID=UPI00096D5672|nr:aspartyl/asparaginyl beta-hydroxylase domain-containing protein [Sphingomonas montana]